MSKWIEPTKAMEQMKDESLDLQAKARENSKAQLGETGGDATSGGATKTHAIHNKTALSAQLKLDGQNNAGQLRTRNKCGKATKHETIEANSEKDFQC